MKRRPRLHRFFEWLSTGGLFPVFRDRSLGVDAGKALDMTWYTGVKNCYVRLAERIALLYGATDEQAADIAKRHMDRFFGRDPTPQLADEVMDWIRDEVGDFEVTPTRIAQLVGELRLQWEYNHAEHCGWLPCKAKDCNWPLPVSLGGDPGDYRSYG